MLIFYSLFYCMFYCTRLNLANAGSEMMASLGFSTADIGILTATLFWAYAIGMLVGGRISEIVGYHRFIMISAFATVLMNVLFGFLSSLPLMILVWAVNGLAQSMNWPAGCTLLSNWWPGKTRGFAVGFASAFSGFGQAVAMLVVAMSFLLFPGLSWRSAFFIPAAFPLLFYLIFRVFTKSSPEKIGLRAYKEEDPEAAANERALQEIVAGKNRFFPYKLMLSNGEFVRIIVMHTFVGITRYGLLTWVPMYFTERFGVNIMESLLASLALPVGMGFGSLILPAITDRMKNRMAVVPWTALGAALSVIGFLFLDPRTTAGLILIETLLFIAGFFIYAIAGVLNVVACDYGGRVLSGTANGIFGFTGYLGAGIQSVIYGAIVAHTGWNMVFISIAAFSGIIAFLSVLKRKSA